MPPSSTPLLLLPNRCHNTTCQMGRQIGWQICCSSSPTPGFFTPAHKGPYHDPHFQGTFRYIYTEANSIASVEAQGMYVEMAEIEKDTCILKYSSYPPHMQRPQ